jgi:asparagine synthase (glutamine-hydrolysing)
MNSVFVSYVLAGERLDMAHGVEVRLPFLDHHLFEWARGIPVELLARDRTQKWILREAVRPLIPDEVYRGRKHGFFAPPAALTKGGPMYEMIIDLLNSRTSQALPFFEPRAVRKLLERAPHLCPQEQREIEPLLLAMGSLAVLQERFRL